MNVSACIATRGDVEIEPLLQNFPHSWEILVWDNGNGKLTRWFWADGLSAGEYWEMWQHDMSVKQADVPDLGPHARFAAIEWATNDLILTQDDDVIVSNPQEIVDAWIDWRDTYGSLVEGFPEDAKTEHVVCNLPQEFRPHYPDSSLVGFGAAFHRDAPQRAFDRFFAVYPHLREDPLFYRESCRVFTTLTPRVLVDVAKTDMPYASDPGRLWMQPDHVASRERILADARYVRDNR